MQTVKQKNRIAYYCPGPASSRAGRTHIFLPVLDSNRKFCVFAYLLASVTKWLLQSGCNKAAVIVADCLQTTMQLPTALQSSFGFV